MKVNIFSNADLASIYVADFIAANIRECFMNDITDQIPATYLKGGRNVEVVLDSGSSKYFHSDIETASTIQH